MFGSTYSNSVIVTKKGRMKMSATLFELTLVALVLFGIVKEEKLIEFEDKMADKLAKRIADIIVASRRRKSACEQKNQPKLRLIKGEKAELQKIA